MTTSANSYGHLRYFIIHERPRGGANVWRVLSCSGQLMGEYPNVHEAEARCVALEGRRPRMGDRARSGRAA